MPAGAPVPGPRFLGVAAGIGGLVAKGYPLSAVAAALLTTFLLELLPYILGTCFHFSIDYR